MENKKKLFQTVLGIYEKGAAELTSSERSFIEAETRAMLNAAATVKKAEMAPPGFEEFLGALGTAENADEAFSMIVDFMKSKGDLDKANPLLEMDKGPMDLLDAPMDKPLDESKGIDLPGESESVFHEKEESPLEEKLEEKSDSPFEDKKEDSPFEDKKDDSPLKEKKDDDKKEEKSEDKEDKKEDKKEDLKDLKAKILRKAEEMSDDEKEEKKEEKKEDKKEDDKEEKSEDKEEKSEDKEDKKEASHLSKIKVKITPRRDICAYYDGKPAFYAVVNSDVKADMEALKRTANKVFGWMAYEGLKVAAAKCGARLMAGVDDDIEVVHDMPVAPASDAVVDNSEDVIEETLETPENDSRDEAEFDHQEPPTKVEAGVEDNAEVVTEEKPDPKPESVTADEEDVIEEPKETPEDDSRDGADVDFKTAEANYKKLYASRAKKMAIDAQNKFVAKFIRAMKLAARRMELNYDHNPYKAASFDVLVSETGMEPDFASDLVESISKDGHSQFVNQLLERTSSLMKKSDEYLEDMESDLNDLKVKPVDVPKSAKKASKKSANLRKEASEGNFAVRNPRTPVTSPASNNNLIGGIKSAVGDTLLSRRATRIKGQ